MTSLIDGRIRM